MDFSSLLLTGNQDEALPRLQGVKQRFFKAFEIRTLPNERNRRILDSV
jgi:hypothetical protein